MKEVSVFQMYSFHIIFLYRGRGGISKVCLIFQGKVNTDNICFKGDTTLAILLMHNGVFL